MATQKHVTKKKATTTFHRRAVAIHPAHKRRGWWFAALISGLVLIQLAYNVHLTGTPRVLGYATSTSSDELLRLTNERRTASSLHPLTLNEKLSRAAQAKANNMIAGDYWNHIAPDGTTPWGYIQKADYHYQRAGENLAYGFTTDEQIVTAWMHSREHRDNILGDYSEVGFGYASSDHYQHGRNTVVVALYGLPRAAHSTEAASSDFIPSTSSEQHVFGAATVVNGSAPWATYASLALIGASFIGFLVTHLETLRLGWRNARRYVVLHPVFDLAVLLALAFIILQAAGGFIQ